MNIKVVPTILVVVMISISFFVVYWSNIINFFVDEESVEPVATQQFVDTQADTLPVPDSKIIDEQGSLYIYTINKIPNSAVAASISVNEDGGYPLVNLALDFNRDEKYGPYTTKNGKTQEEWVLKNVPAYLLADKINNYEFNVVDPEIYSLSNVFGQLLLTEDKQYEEWQVLIDESYRKILFRTKQVELSERLGLNVPGIGPDLYRGSASFGEMVSNIFTGNSDAEGRVWNFDSIFDVPDHTQNAMECAPTVMADSLLALIGSRIGVGGLPEKDEMISKLRKTLKYGDDGREGVLKRNFITGANEFMRQHELPIVTNKIDNPNIVNIKEMIEDGRIVMAELSHYYYNNGDPIHETSHLVVVTGISVLDDKYYIRGKDPATPEGIETWQLSISDMKLSYPKWQKGDTYITRLYTQNWISAAEAVAIGLLPLGSEEVMYPMEMLRIGGAYYPRYQFTRKPADEFCSSSYYDSDNLVVGLKYKGRRDLVQLESEGGCGFGETDRLPTEVLELSWYQQQLLTLSIDDQQ